MNSATVAPAAIEFVRFRVLPHRRWLLAGNLPVELGGRGSFYRPFHHGPA
jgi:hypothetical protein